MSLGLRQEELTITLDLFETEGTWDEIQELEDKKILKLFQKFVERKEFWDGDARWTSYFRILLALVHEEAWCRSPNGAGKSSFVLTLSVPSLDRSSAFEDKKV